MCRALKVHRSGYYAWKAEPLSARAIQDAALLVEIKQSYEDSQGIYGCPRIHRDLREAGFYCAENLWHASCKKPSLNQCVANAAHVINLVCPPSPALIDCNRRLM